MFSIGDRVVHEPNGKSNGHGTVLGVRSNSGMVLVEWDTHRVKRTTRNLSQSQSHVKWSTLARLSDSK